MVWVFGRIPHAGRSDLEAAGAGLNNGTKGTKGTAKDRQRTNGDVKDCHDPKLSVFCLVISLLLPFQVILASAANNAVNQCSPDYPPSP